jgi:hypothetical protein
MARIHTLSKTLACCCRRLGRATAKVRAERTLLAVAPGGGG